MTPLDDADWPQVLAHLSGTFATDLNVYRVMARHPALLASWETFREHVVKRSALGPERAEVVVIRCGVEWQASYEVAHHRERARSLGFDEARLGWLMGSRAAIAGSDRVLADAVADLVRKARLAKRSRERLNALVGEAGILDLFATVGLYAVLAYITKSYDTPIEPDLVNVATRQIAPRFSSA